MKYQKVKRGDQDEVGEPHPGQILSQTLLDFYKRSKSTFTRWQSVRSSASAGGTKCNQTFESCTRVRLPLKPRPFQLPCLVKLSERRIFLRETKRCNGQNAIDQSISGLPRCIRLQDGLTKPKNSNVIFLTQPPKSKNTQNR